MNPIVVIPARMKSTRLPGKPLALIAGEPMIVHVWRRATEARVGPVAVACAEEEIAQAVRAAGGTTVLTRPDLQSGSDRVHEAVSTLDPERRHDVVVNVQGDLPLIDPEAIRLAAAPLADSSIDIATLAAPIRDPAEIAANSVVKVAAGFRDGARVARALYFSRIGVPWGEGPRYHHIGIYAFRRAALEHFVTLPPAAIELRESLEQLRALEAGMRIAVTLVEAVPFGVDTPEDLARARAMALSAGS